MNQHFKKINLVPVYIKTHPRFFSAVRLRCLLYTDIYGNSNIIDKEKYMYIKLTIYCTFNVFTEGQLQDSQ